MGNIHTHKNPVHPLHRAVNEVGHTWANCVSLADTDCLCVSLSPGWCTLAAHEDLQPRAQTWCLLLEQAQDGASSHTSFEWRPTGTCRRGHGPWCRGHTLPPSSSKKSPSVSVGVCCRWSRVWNLFISYGDWSAHTAQPCAIIQLSYTAVYILLL